MKWSANLLRRLKSMTITALWSVSQSSRHKLKCCLLYTIVLKKNSKNYHTFNKLTFRRAKEHNIHGLDGDFGAVFGVLDAQHFRQELLIVCCQSSKEGNKEEWSTCTVVVFLLQDYYICTMSTSNSLVLILNLVETHLTCST